MARERDRCRGAEIFKEFKSHYRMDQIPSAKQKKVYRHRLTLINADYGKNINSVR